jgi:rsbT co-antagonist protein RsbR
MVNGGWRIMDHAVSEEKNIALYEYIIQTSSLMTDSWLESRGEEEGSIYGQTISKEVEQRLRDQNALFIQTIAKAFTTEVDHLNTDINKWAKKVAADRAATGTPIYEIIHQFKVFRGIFWDQIKTFILKNSHDITHEDLLKWSSLLHAAFDTVIEQFAEQYYIFTSNRLEAQQEMINELSSPVISLSDTVGILPLVGEIDTQRAKYILESTLIQCTENGIDQLFIDLSGVAVMDTMVAQQIFQLMHTLKLLGVDSVISGVRPEVAQTSVQLGIDFRNIPTQNSLKQALENNDIIIKNITIK